MGLSPDPLLTANLFCAGHLDEAIRRVVAPFRRRLGQGADGGPAFLWLVRYGRGGEHLKLRVHAAPSQRARAASALEGLAGEFLAPLRDSLPPPGGEGAASPPPPLDSADESAEEREPLGFLWTEYRRSPISLAPEPFLSDDRYVGLMTSALGHGCDLVLEALSEEVSPRLRALHLLQALIGALAALRLPPEGRNAYLAFHRDRLIRFLLVRRGAPPSRAAKILAQFDRQESQMAPLLVSLREQARREWDGDPESRTPDEPADRAWRDSILSLHAYVSTLLGDPACHLDPLAVDPAFPLLFKALHGVANQLGLSPVDEAFCLHLLLAPFEDGGEGRPPARLYDPALGEGWGEGPEGSAADRGPRASPGSLSAVGEGARPELSWFHFVARSGAEGKEWLARFLAEPCAGLSRSIDRALLELRRRKISEGKDLLDQVEQELASQPVEPSVLLVLQRFYWSTQAYYHYCVEELDLAEEGLERARQAIVAVLDRAPFLLPLAIHCHEFLLQRVRIARHRRRWPEMKHHLLRVRRMLEDQEPLCVLADGRPIRMATLVDFHRAIPGPEPGELEALRFFLDRSYRAEAISSTFMNLYTMPDSVTWRP